MRTRLGHWGLAIALLTACSDDAEPPEEKRCTLIGCTSSLKVQLVFPGGAAADGFDVRVEHAGQSMQCNFEADNDPCYQGSGPASPPGDERSTIFLSDTPDELQITVTSGAWSETQVINPEYTIFEPNGPGCGSCRLASLRVQFGL